MTAEQPERARPAPGASPAAPPVRARSGRRAGDSGTREAILNAARARFAEHGYDGATIRGIAASAGVDPALVHHFYGSKERLFAAAMRLPVVPSEVLAAAFAEADRRGDQFSPGEQLVRTALTVWESSEVLGIFIGLLRSALTSDAAASMLREFLTDAIIGPIAALTRARHPAADPADAAYRASAAASQMVGLALTRHVIQLGPITEASIADLAATVGPTLDRYLTGDIRARPDGG